MFKLLSTYYLQFGKGKHDECWVSSMYGLYFKYIVHRNYTELRRVIE